MARGDATPTGEVFGGTVREFVTKRTAWPPFRVSTRALCSGDRAPRRLRGPVTSKESPREVRRGEGVLSSHDANAGQPRDGESGGERPGEDGKAARGVSPPPPMCRSWARGEATTSMVGTVGRGVAIGTPPLPRSVEAAKVEVVDLYSPQLRTCLLHGRLCVRSVRGGDRRGTGRPRDPPNAVY